MKEEEEDGGLFLSPQIVSKTASKTQDSEQRTPHTLYGEIPLSSILIKICKNDV